MEPGRFGRRRPRREVPELLTGEATYTDDLAPSGTAHAAILRSRYGPRASTASRSTRPSGSTASSPYSPGEISWRRTPPVSSEPTRRSRASVRLTRPSSPLIPSGTRGEAVAVVLAEDRYVAHDTLDHIEVATTGSKPSSMPGTRSDRWASTPSRCPCRAGRCGKRSARVARREGGSRVPRGPDRISPPSDRLENRRTRRRAPSA